MAWIVEWDQSLAEERSWSILGLTVSVGIGGTDDIDLDSTRSSGGKRLPLFHRRHSGGHALRRSAFSEYETWELPLFSHASISRETQTGLFPLLFSW